VVANPARAEEVDVRAGAPAFATGLQRLLAPVSAILRDDETPVAFQSG